MKTTKSIFNDTITSLEYSKKYIAYLSEILFELNYADIAKAIDLILRAREENRRIFFIGNGGSAATASHFANDLSVGTRSTNLPLRVISLTDNNSVITAIANDYGYEYIFVKQLEVLFTEGDLLVAISASGNSENLLKAVDYVNSCNGISIGLTGFDGGKLKGMVDYVIHVPTEKGEYGPVEDIHMIFDHIIGTYLMYYFNKER